jgi:uridine nucleosidase
MKKTIWLDCDTGSDDSFAIILANHHDKVHLLGISTVFGNNSLHYTT